MMDGPAHSSEHDGSDRVSHGFSFDAKLQDHESSMDSTVGVVGTPASPNVCPVSQEAVGSPGAQGDLGSEVWHDGPTTSMPFHEFANVFPTLGRDDFFMLVEDVRKNGVREPIVMLDGKILDGRNRYLAARECGRGYRTVEFLGEDALGYVVSLNLHRRHLNESQRAMVAAKLAKLPTHRPREDNPANLRVPPTTTQVASLMNVSPRSVESARAVVRAGAPGLVESVEAGRIALGAAAEVSKLSEDAQRELLAEGPAAVRAAASNLRRKCSLSPNSAARESRDEPPVGVEKAILAQGGPSPRRALGAAPAAEPGTLAFVAAASAAIAERVRDNGFDNLFDGDTGEGNRERYLESCRAGHAALTQILSAFAADAPA